LKYQINSNFLKYMKKENKIMKVKNTLFAFSLILFIGCENQNNEDIIEEIVVIDVVTSDVNQQSFFYNFHENISDSINWQLMFHNLEVLGGGYSMPSFSLDSNKVVFAVDSLSEFDDIIEIPSISLYMNSTSDLSYLGKYAILNYDMSVHKVSTSNYIYFIYDLNSHQIFKLYFNNYSGGVVSFKYADLNNNDHD